MDLHSQTDTYARVPLTKKPKLQSFKELVLLVSLLRGETRQVACPLIFLKPNRDFAEAKRRKTKDTGLVLLWRSRQLFPAETDFLQERLIVSG